MKQSKITVTQFIKENQIALKDMGAKKIGLFGSFVKNKQNTKSDIDILVTFSKGKKTYKNFIKLAYFLEDSLGREVDLVTEESLSPYLKPSILKEVEYVFTN